MREELEALRREVAARPSEIDAALKAREEQATWALGAQAFVDACERFDRFGTGSGAACPGRDRGGHVGRSSAPETYSPG